MNRFSEIMNTEIISFPSSQEKCYMVQCVAQGPIAQWLEQAAHNGLVAGSNPAGSIFHAKNSLIHT